MSFRLIAVAAILLLFPGFSFAQIEDADLIFRELKVLQGTWFMPQDRGDRLDVWTSVNDSTLAGREMRIKAESGDTVLLQTMQLELRGQSVIYSTTLRGQTKNDPVAYELTLADYDGYLFENPEQENPQKIRYRLLGNRELQVSTEGKRGSRTITEEFVFEREFTPAGLEFRIRGGLNVCTLRGTGNFPPSDIGAAENPKFSPRPGWELGMQFRFKGSGGFINVNVEAGLAGRFSHAVSDFYLKDKTATGVDTFIYYVRDVTYNQTWLTLAAIPEISLKRDGRLTILAGPYFSRLLFNKANGEEKPGGENKLFDANNDFKKNDIGIIAGLQYRLNFGKKDLGGLLGLRASLGLSDLDALYNRNCTNPAFCNGRVGWQGVSLYYSMNLLQL